MNEASPDLLSNTIPDETLLHILSYLDLRSLIAMMITAKKYHRVGSDNQLWYRFIDEFQKKPSTKDPFDVDKPPSTLQTNTQEINYYLSFQVIAKQIVTLKKNVKLPYPISLKETDLLDFLKKTKVATDKVVAELSIYSNLQTLQTTSITKKVYDFFSNKKTNEDALNQSLKTYNKTIEIILKDDNDTLLNEILNKNTDLIKFILDNHLLLDLLLDAIRLNAFKCFQLLISNLLPKYFNVSATSNEDELEINTHDARASLIMLFRYAMNYGNDQFVDFLLNYQLIIKMPGFVFWPEKSNTIVLWNKGDSAEFTEILDIWLSPSLNDSSISFSKLVSSVIEQLQSKDPMIIMYLTYTSVCRDSNLLNHLLQYQFITVDCVLPEEVFENHLANVETQSSLLHLAVKSSNLSAVEILVERGANLHSLDNENKKPLEVASNQEVSRYLESKIEEENETLSLRLSNLSI